jgi:hypothetical protein
VIDTEDRVFFLANSHLFRGLGEEELAVVADMFAEVEHPAQHTILMQNDPADEFFMIYSGSVKVIRQVKQEEQQLAVLVAGDYFGGEALSKNKNQPRKLTTTVIAKEKVRLLNITRAKYDELLKRFSQIKVNFEVSLSSRGLSRKLLFKWVRPDEVIYFIARKHPILLIQGLVGPIFAIFMLLIFFLLYGGVLFQSILSSIISLLFLLAIIGWGVWNSIDWGNDYYIVTNQRVVWLEKVIGLYDSRQEAPLSKILSVGVETALVGRFLEYGNVIVRTFVGRIPFNRVSHPYQAAAIVEEYWRRAQQTSHREDVEAMKDTLREKLGIVDVKPKIKPLAPEKKAMPSLYKPSLLMILSRDIFRLRFEERGTITYRKHILVLLKQVFWSTFFAIITLGLIVWRLGNLAGDERVQLLTNSQGGIRVDTLTLVFLIFFLIILLPWWVYQYLDWSNDIFQVTQDQIFDIDKKPFGSEQRRAAPLDSILSTRADRVGFLGYIFNYGNVYISVGSAEFVFESVFDPVAVQLDIDIRRLAHNAKKQEAKDKAERENMAEWLATYNRTVEEINRKRTFEPIFQKVESLPESEKKIALEAIRDLEQEAAKGDNADEKSINEKFESLARTAVDAFELAIDTLSNPIIGIAKLVMLVAKKYLEEKNKKQVR